jgi:hypothetical protein
MNPETNTEDENEDADQELYEALADEWASHNCLDDLLAD